jgi:glycosyltransferase involved in cell wall biosynthesis
MFLYYDNKGIVRIATTRPVVTNRYHMVEVADGCVRGNPIGRRLSRRHEEPGGMRLAVICNWGDACGIATYAKYLIDALRPLVGELRIFAEDTGQGKTDGIDYCWKRGRSMEEAIRRVIAWRPSVVLIQHEFGIFPKAPYLLQMFQLLDDADIPHVVTLHSVYEHLDKVVCTAAMQNIVVHSATGEACLRRLGHRAEIRVIPHGCVQYLGVIENWNITHTPHAMIQFGFGFRYKGVDRVLEAIADLKRAHPGRYGGETPIHYCYLCSESPHVKRIIDDTYRSITAKIEELGLTDNAVVIRGFQTDDVLNQYLRTYKLAVFPYVCDPKNVVYGASGAARIAMANRIPTITSSSPMFDDLQGVVPRPTPSELADEIDRVFSSQIYKNTIIRSQDAYISANSWAVTGRRYLDFLGSVVASSRPDVIFI